ncbi:MAG: two-component system, OmpR family, sensor histidine kinase MprB [Streptomycetaceae bacterium]|nr:two-component system, OmpR family, sensor histidine kinase MprB [Streptomycetaceae bacterium]
MISRLPLRARLALLTAVAVAIAIAASATACWYITANELRGDLDDSLTTAMISMGWVDNLNKRCGGTPPDTEQNAPPARITGQMLKSDGTRCIDSEDTAIQVTASDLAVAANKKAKPVLRTGIRDNGTRVRILTLHTPRGATMMIARPMSELEDPLNKLGVLLGIVGGGGILTALGTGLLVARSALRPVNRLTAAVEHIARTEDLKVRIPVSGRDEIARLSHSFNSMTAALESSRDHQQRLIADAGHELRTPLTSLRANIDLLVRSNQTGRPIPAHKRDALLGSLQDQTTELTCLIGDLLELSRPEAIQPTTAAPTPLHNSVDRALQRAQLRGPHISFVTDVQPWYVQGDAASLERAVVNLLDNAVKFSPPDGRIEVRLRKGELTVRDYGPGIPAEELPHVFERFWRSPSARSMPGSGLGLSIVAHTVQRSGGSVALQPAYGGGTMARIHLPGAPQESSGIGHLVTGL